MKEEDSQLFTTWMSSWSPEPDHSELSEIEGEEVKPFPENFDQFFVGARQVVQVVLQEDTEEMGGENPDV